MSVVVELQTENGPLFVEVDENQIPPVDDRWELTDSSSKNIKLFSNLVAPLDSVIKTAFTTIQKGLSDLSPDELELVLGLKLSIDAGVWSIAKASTEGHLIVKAKWSRE